GPRSPTQCRPRDAERVPPAYPNGLINDLILSTAMSTTLPGTDATAFPNGVPVISDSFSVMPEQKSFTAPAGFVKTPRSRPFGRFTPPEPLTRGPLSRPPRPSPPRR